MKENFAFTLQVPSFKKVYYFQKKRFIDFDSSDQMGYLEFLIQKSIDKLDLDEGFEVTYDIVFEKHLDGRWHSHGTIFSVSLQQIQFIQSTVCKMVGVKTQKQFNEIFCFVPIYRYTGWQTYILKTEDDQNMEALYHNDVLEREEYFETYRF